MQALPLIVKGLRAAGLELVTLDELFRKALVVDCGRAGRSSAW